MGKGSTLDNYTIGVSKSGIEQIKNDIKLYLIDTACDILDPKSTQCSDLCKAISEMWSGEDKDVFLSNMHRENVLIVEDLKEIKTKIDTVLDQVYESWCNFQKNNVK